MEINGDVITNSREVKLLGVTLDSQLKFKSYAKALCVKANRKVNAFARIVNYITSKIRHPIINRHPKSKITLSIIYCVNVHVLPFELDVLWKSSE